MNSTHSSVARVISTGFLVSLMFCTALFWMNAVLRKIGKEDLNGRKSISFNLAGYLGDKIPVDPNMKVRDPWMICDTPFAESDIFLDSLLKIQYWITGSDFPSYPGQFAYELDTAEIHAKWYPEQGLIVKEEVQTPLQGETQTPQIRYVGPKGFSDTPDMALERFSDPQLCSREYPSTLFIYDTDLKVFFKIDFASEKVTSKSWADKSIIETNRACLSKLGGFLDVYVRGPSRWETDQEMKARVKTYGRDLQSHDQPYSVPYGPSVRLGLPGSDPWAMDDQGTIYLIDRDTLSLSPPKGQLPRCGKEKTYTPSQLLAYSAFPLFVDQEYFGLVAASLSRDSSESVMVLLDQQGRVVERSSSHLETEKYRYGLMTSYARRTLDFAQPLVFSAASSLWGPRMEAMAGYRSLFVLPLSMPGRIAGDETLKPGDRVGTLIMWNVFTWCVGLLLAIAVSRDVKGLGMPGKTQKAWLFACMGFGWIAAITYLLTRPRFQFVTCAGCGRTRRTDQALCLHCEAGWQMCELQTPVWRVVD
jgi:hypothetical protein